MSILRIVNPGPVIRDHYGTLWHDSQHPIGYLLTLIAVPLFLAVVVGQFLTVTWEVVGFLTVFYGAVLALSARSAFNIPSIGEADGEREAAALQQLRRTAMYAVFLGLVSFLTSLIVASGHFIVRQNPSVVEWAQANLMMEVVPLVFTVTSTVLIFLLVHYLFTLAVLFRWLYLTGEAGSL
jgi:hypothetical protein